MARTNFYRRASKNVYQEAKKSYRLRYRKNGVRYSKTFTTKKAALAWRKVVLGF